MTGRFSRTRQSHSDKAAVSTQERFYGQLDLSAVMNGQTHIVQVKAALLVVTEQDAALQIKMQ